MSLATLPEDLRQDWISKDGQARVEVRPKGDQNDNETMRRFAAAVLEVAPNATGTPILIQELAKTIVRAFLQAGALALLLITLTLFFALRRVTDVLVTLVPLLLAGVVTLELTVLFGLPLNFANIIALPLLLGVGVAFKIYYVLAWRGRRDEPARLIAHPRRAVQRCHHGVGFRQPLALQPSGNIEHGQAAQPRPSSPRSSPPCCSSRS